MLQETMPYITVDEFLSRYAEQRAEWVDGEVIVLANNVRHNAILEFLIKLFGLVLDFNPIGVLIVAGVPMRLGEGKPIREPDLMIMLNEHKDRVKETYIDGQADIVVEIVSPESVARDYGDKFLEYETAGIPEYWLFDPDREQVFLYALEERAGKFVYIRQPEDEHGRAFSRLLPGAYLEARWMRDDARPQGAQLVQLAQAMSGAAR
jgi:Uma2 family endonuclease